MYDKLKDEDRQILQLDCRNNQNELTGEYLDMYEGAQPEVLSTSRFDEYSDMTRASKIKAEEKIPISEQGYTVGKLLDGTECQILLDMRAGKSLRSKLHYVRYKSLHLLPKFASKMQRMQVGNGKYIHMVFIIPIVIDTQGHRFEIFI